MLNSYQEIIESFTNNQFFGITHVLETLSEDLCACYFIELKPKYSQNKDVQFATLWRLMEVTDQDYSHIANNELQENLTEEFQYILDSWNPRPIVSKDITKAMNILRDCQSEILNNPKKERLGKERLSGYYLNDRYNGPYFPSGLKTKLSQSKSGFVVYDDWDQLMIVIEEKNVYSLFYWYTDV